MLHYHVTVTSALQAVARLARSSPMAAVIQAPVQKAQAIAERQVNRHPTIQATHVTRTALRKAQVPAVQLVVMPPQAGGVVMLLLSNLAPPESRETWRHAFDEDEPLTWRNYQLTRGEDDRITWRFNEQARAHYRQRVARIITGRGGLPAPGERPYQLSPETAHAQVLRLAAHMTNYPGLSGVRADVFDLAQYSTRVWRGTHGDLPYPVWPTMPYARFSQPRLAPLSDLLHSPEEPHHEQDQEADEDPRP